MENCEKSMPQIIKLCFRAGFHWSCLYGVMGSRLSLRDMKRTMSFRPGALLALVAAGTALVAPAPASAAPGDIGTRCADFLASRPEAQASIVRDILSARGARTSASPGGDASRVNSAIAGCQSNFGGLVSEVLGGR